MGGDFAPSAPVAGALLALSELDPGHRVQLVGRTSVLREQVDAHLSGEFAALKPHADRLDLIDATDVIDMSDKPSAALRGKPNSSMHVGLKLQVDGKSDAFVSAGNTGAQMAVSTVVLRLHHGVQRLSRRFSPRRANRSSSSTPAPTSTAVPSSWCSSPG
jgi:glycerol-3-phosphate acyltransferase PlsX